MPPVSALILKNPSTLKDRIDIFLFTLQGLIAKALYETENQISPQSVEAAVYNWHALDINSIEIVAEICNSIPILNDLNKRTQVLADDLRNFISDSTFKGITGSVVIYYPKQHAGERVKQACGRF